MLIQPTARVTLVTAKGNIDIELYAKELPQLCRAFLENCVNKRYVGLKFSTIEDNLVQLLKLELQSKLRHEYHSRLKFDSRGTVGLLNHESTNYASADGFFITLKPTPEFNGNSVLIGKVVGDSFYNVVKLLQAEKKEDGVTPLFPVEITDVLVSERYFDDIVTEQRTEERKVKKQKTAVKLSYDDEEEEEDEGFVMKSAHELLAKERKKPKAEEEKRIPLDQKLEAKESNEEEKDEKQEEEEDKEKHEEEEKDEKPEDEENEDEGDDESEERAKRVRDPTIDPYDRLLDMAEDDVDYEKLMKHRFVCSN